MREFILVVAAISAPFLIGTFLVHYFRYRTLVMKRLSSEGEQALARENAELKGQVQNLRERIEVLEAIVTDHKYDLGRKIANL